MHRPLVELVDHVVQAAEEPGHKGLADEDQRLNSWLDEVNCRNEEDRLAEDMVGVVELACAVHRIEEQGFAVVAVYCGVCKCLDDHTDHQPVEARKAQLACHQARRLQDLHCASRTQKQQGHRSVL